MGTLNQGAKNAIEVCLRVKPKEHVLIVTDKRTYAIGNGFKIKVTNFTPDNKTQLLRDRLPRLDSLRINVYTV